MDEPAVETTGLRKRFGAKVAVDDLTLTVRRGEVFGFLGPNGAGKTTSVKMLLGLTRPTSGSARVLGAPIGDRAARGAVGFLPEHFRFQEWLTGREFLSFHGRLHGMRGGRLDARIDELLERVDLTDAADRKLHGYSKGMLQRVGLAQALLNEPALVFLDEPTSGLDPIGRRLVRDCIADLRRAGTSVFLNSHLLGEVELTCDRVAFVKRGRVVREMALGEDETGVEVDLRVGRASPDLFAGLERFGRVTTSSDEAVTIHVAAESRLPEIARYVVESGAELYRLAARRRSLEELFLEVIGTDERAG
jgi:ABC-2 type transport system ATP-binding protein